MRARGRWAVLGLVLAAGVSPPAGRAETPCFDLSQPVTKPLVEAPSGESTGDQGDSGTKTEGRAWARLRGRVAKPIARVLAMLQDHQLMRDPSIDELAVERRDRGPHLARLRVHSRVKPFLFVRVEWTDEWAYTLVEGTPEAPQKIVVAYQKIAGTSNIAHFCGNVVLRRLDAATTEVYQYEESKITGRSQREQAESLVSLLALLRTTP